MAVNQNVNPRPLTAEEKEKRARGIYDSFATYVVFCGHCHYVRKTNMYIMRAEAFIDELDARFGRQGNAWTHLTRALLLFKLDRTPAARRALRGFASLCRGGAYALLRPTFVEPYLPDRPDAEPGSYAEAMMAVHECDPAIMDTPD
ncbi:MAG: hypothetical protein EGQ45_00305, partial [Clostridiales bacterium]|nr:hypothetical protein [Clostridiales bacterium]